MFGRVVKEEEEEEEERGREDGGVERLRLRRSVSLAGDVLAAEAARRAAERVTRAVLEDDDEVLLIEEGWTESYAGLAEGSKSDREVVQQLLDVRVDAAGRSTGKSDPPSN